MVAGTSTLVAAPINIMIAAMPIADLTALISLYNKTATTPVSAASATASFVSEANGGNLSANFT